MSTCQKLELTWVGKYNEIKLEPRILIEDTEKSYGDINTENMLIKGDNLLALKALEQEYSGKIKCIYIDPPYNTGTKVNSDGIAIGYDDGLEHSEWLNMMKPRLILLKRLLHEDGALVVQIDDNEYARLYILMGEIFGEKNLKTICVKMSEASGVKMTHVINKGRIPKLKEYLIIARKNGVKNLYIEKIPKDKWDNEYKTLLLGIDRDEINILKKIINDENRSKSDIKLCDEILEKLFLKSLSEYYKDQNINTESAKLSFNYENSWRIIQVASVTGSAKILADNKRKTITQKYFCIETPKKKLYIVKGDYSIDMKKPRIQFLFADDYLMIHPGDFWQDIKTTVLDNEGGVAFKNGKKPETLIKRIIDMGSNKNDLILDSFLGSGTTAAVANKMGRRWIGIELNGHCDSHCIPRLKSVVDGNDQSGISKAVNWKGGGGFKYFTLAPSLLKKDSYNNWIIDEVYNPDMLAHAMSKIEGFRYNPDENYFWKQGKSTENDFLFTTTVFITLDYLEKIHNEMKPEESLLICCKAFQEQCIERFSNITIKKIPQAILGKCEFGKENYSFSKKIIFDEIDLELENASEKIDMEVVSI